jgi:hypothetical protein
MKPVALELAADDEALDELDANADVAEEPEEPEPDEPDPDEPALPAVTALPTWPEIDAIVPFAVE